MLLVGSELKVPVTAGLEKKLRVERKTKAGSEFQSLGINELANGFVPFLSNSKAMNC